MTERQPSLKSKGALLVLVFAVSMLVLTAPSAEAVTAFSETWESGWGAWSHTGSASISCTSPALGCSLLMNPGAGGSAVITKATNVPIAADSQGDTNTLHRTILEFDFNPTLLNGATESRVEFLTNTVSIIMDWTTPSTSGSCGGTNAGVTATIGATTAILGCLSAGNCWSHARVDIALQPDGSYAAFPEFRDCAGNWGSNGWYGLPAGTSTIVNVRITGFTTGTSGTPNYVDNLSVWTSIWQPSAPQSLTASPGPGAGHITLNWQAPSYDGGGALTQYNVMRAGSSGVYSQVGTATPPMTTFVDSNLPGGTTWTYYVTAQNAYYTSAASNTASATTFVAPSAPQNLQAFPVTKIALALTWQAPETAGQGTIDHYSVFQSTVSGPGKSLAGKVGSPAPGVPPPTALLKSVPGSSTTYYFQVNATNTLGASGPLSNEAAAALLSNPTTPAPPGSDMQHNLLTENGVPVGAIAPGASVGNLTTYDDSTNHLCFDVTIVSQTTNLACVPKSDLVGVDSAIPRGQTPLGTQTASLANATVSVSATYYWDDSHLQQDKLTLAGTNVYAPASVGDFAWMVGPGGQATQLLVTVSVYQNGQLVTNEPVSIPFVGQAIAAAASTGGV